jgi:hypothetical protein
MRSGTGVNDPTPAISGNSPMTNRGCTELVSDDFPVFHWM